MKTLIFCGQCKGLRVGEELNKFSRYRCTICGSVNQVLNITIKSWVGFNYKDYLQAIKEFIDKDDFSLLSAKSKTDLDLGLFSKEKIVKLKEVLKKAYDEGASMRDLAKMIDEEVKPGKRYVMKGDKKTLVSSGMKRSVNIARTETTRTANAGASLHYKKLGVKQVSWVAALSDRTCPICSDLNGQVFPIGTKVPPAHSLCRCTIAPITEL